MPNTSPNMLLPIPIVGVDSGLVWEQSLVSCLTLIDQHMHAPTYGVQITPSGISINESLPFNNFSATGMNSLFLTQLSAPLSSSNLSALYSGNGATGDLFWNDGAGNQIRITAGGTVNATSSGISSGTATASFSSGVLVVNAASNTPANIQAGSILLGNNVANSKYLTLSPPSAMAANFTITLPSLPASIKILTMDAAGNMAANYDVDNSTIQVSSNIIQVKNGGITPVKLSAALFTLGASSGTQSTSSTTFIGITNASIGINGLIGRPVYVALLPDGNDNSSIEIIAPTATPTSIQIQLVNGIGSQIASWSVANDGNSTNYMALPTFVDTAPVTPNNTYTFNVKVSGPSAIAFITKVKAYAQQL